MGSSIIKKEDPILQSFVQSEIELSQTAPSYHPYIPFKDYGAPLHADGSIDVDFVRKFGVTLPEKMYLALGDNHANSLDGRYCGFIPEENIRGSATALLWPPGPRWGSPNQLKGSWIIAPRILAWGILAFIILAIWIYEKRNTKVIFVKLSSQKE